MKSLAAFLFFLLAAVPWPARAQTVTGVIVDDSSHAPVPIAEVSVRRMDGVHVASVLTDSAGAFRFKLVHPGRFVLRVSHPSFLSFRSDTLAVEQGEVLTLQVRMGRHVVPLEPLVVAAPADQRLRGFYDRVKHGGFGHFLTREDIERRQGLSVTNLLHGMPGVRVVPVAPCFGCAPEDVVYMRGGIDRCLPTVFIDGMMVPQDATFPLDDFLTSDMLEGVEVYPDGAGIPTDLIGSRTSCGVVAFWTRPPEGGKLTWKRLAAVGGILLAMLALFLH